MEHNWRTKLEKLIETGDIPIGTGEQHVLIYHDDDCGVFTETLCNCDPDIRLKQQVN